MLVLAIDTALEACSAAVLDSTRDVALASETQPMTRGHAEALMPLLARVMDKAAVAFSHLDRVAVTVGPGSFTGLRVGIAAGRGIALATGKPVAGVSTLAALAAPHTEADPNISVAAAIDGRHGNVYFQLSGPGGGVLLPPCMMAAADAAAAAAEAHATLVGSGAAMLEALWPARREKPATDPRRAPDILWVARLGAELDPDQAAPKPLYLRPPDAHPQMSAVLPRR